MTKKHFIALADYLRGDKQFTQYHIDTLARFCASQNWNFNRERWLSYLAGECGPNGRAIKPPRQPRIVKPERRLARRLEGY